MKPATFAPVYAALYPDLAELFRKHGYALAVHGSVSRDFDLIAVPWVPNPSTPEEMVEAVIGHWAVRVIGKPARKHHGREVWTLSFAGGCFLDLSFIPAIGERK